MKLSIDSKLTLTQRKTARVLFDEFHSEAWSISPEVARQMQPGAPFDSSYAKAANYLAERDFVVGRNADAPLSAAVLGDIDVLVIAHPSERKWEHTTNANSPQFSDDEMLAIRTFVAHGGGLVVIGETENDKYGNNLNALLENFGIQIETVTVFDYKHYHNVTSWVKAQPNANAITANGPNEPYGLLTRVNDVCFYRAGVLRLMNGAKPALLTSDVAQPPNAPVLAATTHGNGRVVVVADSDWLGDEFFDQNDHAQLWHNVVYWVANAAFAAPIPPEEGQGLRANRNWEILKSATNTLRLLQNPDGSVNDAHHAEAACLVEQMIGGIIALKPDFVHLGEYLDCVVTELRAWAGGDGRFGKPDFARALAAFNPQDMRRDGIEHLVVFPLYTPNGSSDTRFEALWVKVPWPAWLDHLERTQYDNDKFVPLMLIDHTDGYDSECAVLFPETVSVGGDKSKATNNFGGIFCDREARRYQRTVQKATPILKLMLPPDMAAWVQSTDLVCEAFMLWDLIHDTSHSHGDLPFDPFMIRQRLPYWMYSLEELRVDLWTFCESVELEKRFPFARYVRYAILLDRIVRFPITGNRVRNYDGLGGQLLFAFLHQRGDVHWRDNTLLIDWDAVQMGVAELRTKVDGLYRSGIDMTKVQYWVAAHDLVAAYVRPNITSKWTRETRVISDESQPKEWINRVLDDEFPLSLFYQALQKKMLT
jgi:uncharacterized membrane protein